MAYVDFTLTEFSPSEAAAITGLSQPMQRDWRRRGFLPSNEGRARFDTFEIAAMLAMKLLADQKIGPAATHELAQHLALGIVSQALMDVDAWGGDHADALTWATLPEPKPLPDEIIARAEERGIDLSKTDGNWNIRSRWLAGTFLRGHGLWAIPSQFFAWFADGTHEWQTSADKFFEGASWEERYHGGVIILDQYALAGMIMDRAKRPLVHVELPRDEEGNCVPPIEYGAPVPLKAGD